MRILVGTPEQVATTAADIVAATVRSGAKVIGVATGGSPQPLYRALAAHRANGLDFSHLRAFALDEYVGIDPEHPESYHSVITRDVSVPLGLTPSLVEVPPGWSIEPDAAADDYEQSIVRAGGVDVQILGIGTNGHIGFNEPGSRAESRTRVVELAESTRHANARYFSDDLARVPTHAMTQGIATILDVRRLVLVAGGVGKADALAAAVMGEETSDVPASFLRRHADATIVMDHESAAKFPRELYELINHETAIPFGSS